MGTGEDRKGIGIERSGHVILTLLFPWPIWPLRNLCWQPYMMVTSFK